MGFVEKFYGGPLDGQEQPATQDTARELFNAESGSRYKRWPDRDSEGVRCWLYTIDFAPEAMATSLGVSARGGALTFGELVSLVEGGKQMRTPDDAPVKALLSWSGKLRSLTVEPGAAG